MYVAAARKIKEDFVVSNPDARRGAGRKNKRKLEPTTSPSSKVARNVTPPSLHALALVGSRLNQEPMGNATDDEVPQPPAACPEPHPQTHTAPTSAGPSCTPSPSLLDQLCTVAENEHTAAAQMLSALSAFS